MKEAEKKFEKLRVNMYMPSELVEEIDELAKVYGASRSVMITFMCKTYLDQQKVVELAKMTPQR